VAVTGEEEGGCGWTNSVVDMGRAGGDRQTSMYVKNIHSHYYYERTKANAEFFS
jgi:hypothetical protein